MEEHRTNTELGQSFLVEGKDELMPFSGSPWRFELLALQQVLPGLGRRLGASHMLSRISVLTLNHAPVQ